MVMEVRGCGDGGRCVVMEGRGCGDGGKVCGDGGY